MSRVDKGRLESGVWTMFAGDVDFIKWDMVQQYLVLAWKGEGWKV